MPSKYYDMEWYVLEDGTKTWVHELEDGEWELDLLTWTKTSSDQGTIQLGIPSDIKRRFNPIKEIIDNLKAKNNFIN